MRYFCFAVFLSLSLLVSCAPVDSMTNRNTVGQPPQYKAGYHDGCASGYVAAGHPYTSAKKNVNLYLNDEVYKVGWDDGFATCKGSYNSLQNSY